MSTGYCNCVTLRAKVRLAIEALEQLTTFDIARDALIKLKKETETKSFCPACQDPADHKVHTCGL